MSEVKHTPGPWAYKNNNHYYDIGLYNEDIDIIYPTTCMGVQHNQEANARLIAAAPELLEALELIASYDSQSHPGICPYGCDCPNIARTAIAKAKGE